MPSIIYLIDPPSPFAPLEDWQAYLARLTAANAESPDPQIEQAIKAAERHIAENR